MAANQRGAISGRWYITTWASTPGRRSFLPFYAEAQCERRRDADSPANVLLERENPAGLLASLPTGEINRVVTTQLPAAATTAACQPRHMHNTPTASLEYGCGGVLLSEYAINNHFLPRFPFSLLISLYLEENRAPFCRPARCCQTSPLF